MIKDTTANHIFLTVTKLVIIIFGNLVLQTEIKAQENDTIFIIVNKDIIDNEVFFSNGNNTILKEEIDDFSRLYINFIDSTWNARIKTLWPKSIDQKRFKNLSSFKFIHYNYFIFKRNNNHNKFEKIINKNELSDEDLYIIKLIEANCSKKPFGKILIKSTDLNKQNIVYLKKEDYDFGMPENLLLELLKYKYIFINLDDVSEKTMFYEVKIFFGLCENK